MSEDFKAIFFEEAAEHLQSIEDELLILDGDRENSDALDSVFRAAHSIKGSAGMFGFGTLSGFTHLLETLLDLVRKGEAELTDDRVEIVLSSIDEIRSLVERLEDGEENPPADENLAKTLELENESVKSGGQPDSPESPGPGAGKAAGEDDSFGLFDDEVADEDESFGLFDDDVTDEDDSFGLFDDNVTDEDDSFGLFDEESAEGEGTDKAPGHAYHQYFDEMLREDPEPSEPQHQKPDAESEPDAEPEPEPEPELDPIEDADPDGKFGWLNRPRKPADEAAGDSGPASKSAESSPKAEPKKTERSSGSLRVSLEKVDQLVNQISELVITQAMLRETAAELDPAEHEQHLASLETLERTARELQESVLSIRLLPVKFLFSRFPRVVRDLSRQLGKDVELVTLGEQTELDKSLIEKLSDPLTHLIRNSVDHGVEQPDKRVEAGKPRQGQVVLSATHEGGDIVISISDDGAGIDRSRVLAKARENGLSVSDDWTDEQVFSLIFEAGFSTAAEVTDVSGRGVGMDVVKRNIKELGGRIDVKSSPGQGSVFTVRLPLTLAITDGMVLRCNDQRLVIPLSNVVESLQLETGDIFHVQGDGSVIRRHGEFVPLYELASMLGDRPENRSDNQMLLAIIVESEGQQIGLLVDELVGQQQIVIKNIETNYRRVPGFSGATVMGDGAVAFIVDVAQLIGGSVILDRPDSSALGFDRAETS